MATIDTDIEPRQTTGERPPLYRLTARQFEEMIGSGIFRGSDHVELLGGLLFENPDKMTKNDPHDFVVGQLAELIRPLLPAGLILREEKSLLLGTTDRPEPDLALVRGAWADFRQEAPRAAQVPLVIEVSDTSYAGDRGRKWRLYASCGIPAYWIVNRSGWRFEVYTDPSGRGKKAKYRTETFYQVGQEVPLILDGQERGRISVKNVLT